jgi:hypothetical protein
VRGISQAASAALLLALAAAVAMALYLALSGMIASAPVPRVQLDPYNTYVVGSKMYVTVKFGAAVESIDLSGVAVLKSDGANVARGCTYANGSRQPPFMPGDSATLECSLSGDPGHRVVVRLPVIMPRGARAVALLEYVRG